mmetsp:Transcript_40203/g.92418  ORF Transcript_40203/g.92418 Transcript_40203/m.92418 type:complete len:1161 (-) Transcript_40203:139-3621(-)
MAEASWAQSEAKLIAVVTGAEHRLHDDLTDLAEKVKAGLHEVHGVLAAIQQSQVQALKHGASSHSMILKSGSARPIWSPAMEMSFSSRRSEADLSAKPLRISEGLANSPSHSGVGNAIQEDGSEDVVQSNTMTSTRVNAVHGRWEGWPGSVCLREELALGYAAENIATLRRLAEVYTANNVATYSTQAEKSSNLQIVHPSSQKRIIFDLLCTIVISMQVVYLPYALVWQTQVEGIDKWILLLTSLFWMFDMFLHFVTGYHTSDGEVEMRLRQVVRHYLRTWFAPDFLCVATDLLNFTSAVLLSEPRTGLTRVLHLVKLQRFLRAIVMLRMLHFAKALQDYMESQLSATWTVMMRTLQFATLIVWLGHILACAWFALGKWAPSGQHGTRWLDVVVPYTDGRYTFADVDPLYQYLSAYHWAVAQITLGGVDITCTNSWERWLAIACNFFGLLFGGTLVSVLATTMVELRELNHDRESKMRRLREFLLQHGVEIGVRLRVGRQVHDRFKHHGRTLVEKDVVALSLLSITLLRELRYHLFNRFVIKHPLLHSWTLLQADSVRHLCGQGLSLQILLQDDELFTAGTPGKAVYVLKEGTLLYSQHPSDGLVYEEESDVLVEGAWISEASWWCYWSHVGTACAQQQCTLVTVPAETVLETMQRDASIIAVTLEYGIRFHKYIITAEETPVTDANVQFADFNGLLCALPTEVHVILGMAALNHVVHHGQHWKLERTGNLKLLEEEIREGRSLVILDHNASLHRRVAITVLQAEKDDDYFLAQVAHFDKDLLEWKPDIRLPGLKQKNGEVPTQALQRILSTRLGQLGWTGTATEFQKNIEEQASKQFGIGTQYIKTTCIVELNADLEAALERHSTMVMHFDPQGVSAPSQRINSTRVKTADVEISERLQQTDVMYVLKGSSYYALYAWIHREDLARLQSHEAQLARFVSALVGNISEHKTTEMVRAEFTAQQGPDENLDVTYDLASPATSAYGHTSSIRATPSMKSGRAAKSVALEDVKKSRGDQLHKSTSRRDGLHDAGVQIGKRPSAPSAPYEQLTSFEYFEEADNQSDGRSFKGSENRSRTISEDANSEKHLRDAAGADDVMFLSGVAPQSERQQEGFGSSRGAPSEPIVSHTRRESFSSFEVDLGGARPPVRGPASQVLFSTESL